jgi:DNA-binding beta-propeller fold protein YncE
MDEVGLRVLLERAVEEEPPMGQLVSHSLLAGRRLAKRRRVKATIAAAVAVALVSVAVPAAFAALRPGAGQPPAALARDRPTAYVWTSSLAQNAAPVGGYQPENAVTPIRLSTGTAYKPLRVPGQIVSMIATPGGTAAYFFSYNGRGLSPPDYMTRINGATGAAGRPVRLARGLEVAQALIAPGGRTAYALGYWRIHGRASWALIDINLATGAVHKLLAVTPDAVPMLIGDSFGLILHDHVLYLPGNGGLAAVDVTTGRALPLIKVQHGVVYGVAIAPDGANAYVYSSPSLGISQPGKPNPAWVTPISLATGRAGTPILALANGDGGGDQIAITPDGRTAYVYGEQAVVPVDLGSGRALKPIAVDLGSFTDTIAISPTGGPAYVSSLSKRLQPISVATSTPGRELVLPGGYSESGPAAFSPGGDVLYVPAAIPGKSGGAIIPINTSTQQAGIAIRVSRIPMQIVVMP